MRGFFEKIGRVFDWMDAIEFAIPTIIAALLLILGPLLVGFYFLRTKQFLPALISGGLWTAAAVACIRDLRRRHFGWASVLLGVLWLITTLVIWWSIESIG